MIKFLPSKTNVNPIVSTLVTSLAFTYWPWANSLKFKIWFINDCRIHYFQSWWPLEQNKSWFIQKISLACRLLHVLVLIFQGFFYSPFRKGKSSNKTVGKLPKNTRNSNSNRIYDSFSLLASQWNSEDLSYNIVIDF